MSRQKAQRLVALLLMIASFTLVALDACLLHEVGIPADKCPVCSWVQSLGIDAMQAPIIPAGGVAVEHVRIERPAVLSPRHIRAPFSARSPPAHLA